MKESFPVTFMLVIMILWMNTLLFGQEMNPLPEGSGLACDFPGDLGIDSHPEVLFHDGFEDSSGLDRWDHVWARDGTGEIVRVTGQTGADGHAYQASIHRPSERGAVSVSGSFWNPAMIRFSSGTMPSTKRDWRSSMAEPIIQAALQRGFLMNCLRVMPESIPMVTIYTPLSWIPGGRTWKLGHPGK